MSTQPNTTKKQLRKLQREIDEWRNWAMRAEGEYERLREAYDRALLRLDRLRDDTEDWETFGELPLCPDEDPDDP